MDNKFDEKLISLDKRLRELRKEIEDNLKSWSNGKPRFNAQHISEITEVLDNKEISYWEDTDNEDGLNEPNN